MWEMCGIGWPLCGCHFSHSLPTANPFFKRCAGMCLNLCRNPTTEFFTSQLGMPLRMTPNFLDYSCEMAFGVMPPRGPEEDELAYQPCLALCPVSGVPPTHISGAGLPGSGGVRGSSSEAVVRPCPHLSSS